MDYPLDRTKTLAEVIHDAGKFCNMRLDVILGLKRAQHLEHSKYGVGQQNPACCRVQIATMLDNISIEDCAILEGQHNILRHLLIAHFPEDIIILIAEKLLEVPPERNEELFLGTPDIRFADVHDDGGKHACLGVWGVELSFRI